MLHGDAGEFVFDALADAFVADFRLAQREARSRGLRARDADEAVAARGAPFLVVGIRGNGSAFDAEFGETRARLRSQRVVDARKIRRHAFQKGFDARQRGRGTQVQLDEIGFRRKAQRDAVGGEFLFACGDLPGADFPQHRFRDRVQKHDLPRVPENELDGIFVLFEARTQRARKQQRRDRAAPRVLAQVGAGGFFERNRRDADAVPAAHRAVQKLVEGVPADEGIDDGLKRRVPQRRVVEDDAAARRFREDAVQQPFFRVLVARVGAQQRDDAHFAVVEGRAVDHRAHALLQARRDEGALQRARQPALAAAVLADENQAQRPVVALRARPEIAQLQRNLPNRARLIRQLAQQGLLHEFRRADGVLEPRRRVAVRFGQEAVPQVFAKQLEIPHAVHAQNPHHAFFRIGGDGVGDGVRGKRAEDLHAGRVRLVFVEEVDQRVFERRELRGAVRELRGKADRAGALDEALRQPRDAEPVEAFRDVRHEERQRGEKRLLRNFSRAAAFPLRVPAGGNERRRGLEKAHRVSVELPSQPREAEARLGVFFREPRSRVFECLLCRVHFTVLRFQFFSEFAAASPSRERKDENADARRRALRARKKGATKRRRSRGIFVESESVFCLADTSPRGLAKTGGRETFSAPRNRLVRESAPAEAAFLFDEGNF